MVSANHNLSDQPLVACVRDISYPLLVASAEQCQMPCSMCQNFSTPYDWSIDWQKPIRVKGNPKHTSSNSLSLLGVQNTELREKMKNSSPKKLLADCWPTVGRLLANSQMTVDRQSTDSRPTVVYRLLRKSSAGSRPTVGSLSADCWPHVGNLLAKCRLRTLVEYQKSLSSQGRTLHIDAK